MRSFMIAISGGCNSGKTTFINALKHIAPDDVEVSDENMRHYKIKSIDDLRNRPDEYFEIEKDIIKTKFKWDKNLRKLENKIILLDRSMIDSYFYYTNYINLEKLSPEKAKEAIEFRDKISKAIDISVKYYDKIMFFESLPVTEKDKFRPENIEEQRLFESSTISHYLDVMTPEGLTERINISGDNLIPRFVTAVFKDVLNNQPLYNNYEIYKNIIEDKYMSFGNILMNTYGSIEYVDQTIGEVINSGLLYSYDKSATDDIIKQIKNIEIEPEFMDSRCYPTGIYSIGGTMIVGEAPGQYGRSIKPTYLKPSFVYAKTSWILRQSLLKVSPMLVYGKAPYITNLLKYARGNNKVTEDDFDKCKHIFLQEVKQVRPELIIALGNSVYTYLQCLHLDNYKIVKIPHPASILYTGCDVQKYSNNFKEILENVSNY